MGRINEYFIGHICEGRRRLYCMDTCGKGDKVDFTGHTWEGRQRRLYWTCVGRTTKTSLLDICGKDK